MLHTATNPCTTQIKGFSVSEAVLSASHTDKEDVEQTRSGMHPEFSM
jgi:hypothetical protein